MSPERIPEEEWWNETGHTWRYDWAAAQVRPGESVLDIACGIGYGSELLRKSDCHYVGVDKPGVPSQTFITNGTWVEADIDTWEPWWDYDVAISFETLEHVADLEHLVGIIKRAKRLICVSVPTIPTVGMNPWHVRDFTVDDVPALFSDWTLVEQIPQPAESSHVYSFTRP
jgi:SAM-dependent methyltransferase